MGKKQKASSNEETATTKHEQPLQAVLLADSFNNNFRPLSLDRPKALCPLNNVALIDYAMDYLAGAGVKEVFVVCTSDTVEEYVEQHHMKASHRMSVAVIKDSFITNAGDALRELDKKSLVESDPFILMHADVISNADLSQALLAHVQRKKRDNCAIMTILMKRVGTSHVVKASNSLIHSPLRSNLEDLVVGLDPSQENRILLYDDRSSAKSVAVPCSFFASHPQVDLHCDLLDCGIDICSPEVLARFSDEFDYRDIRREFVANSVAEEEEGLQNRIFAHLLKPTEYAARVHDLATYDTISRNLLQRWCYPIVPDHLPGGYERRYQYVMDRHYMYYERNGKESRVGRGSVIRGPGMIGSGCTIGEVCHLDGCVIGHGCVIGEKAMLKGCHLWDGVQVGEGASVVQSILGEGATVKAGAKIHRGCIIGAGCIVGEGMELPEFTFLTIKQDRGDDLDDEDWGDDDEEEENDDEAVEENPAETQPVSSDLLLGVDGRGHVWQPIQEEDSPDIYETGLEAVRSKCIGYDPVKLFKARAQFQQEEIAGVDEKQLGGINTYDSGHVNDLLMADADDMFEISAAATERNKPFGRQEGVDVIKELKSICLEYEPTSPIENLAIELNSFKFSQNATYSDCTKAAMLAILERMNIKKGVADGKLVAEFKKDLDHWAPLLRKMSIGLEEEKSIVLALEETALAPATEAGEILSSGFTFRLFLQTLYDKEIVGEDAILSWATNRRQSFDANAASDKTPQGRLFQLPAIQEFVKYLEEEEEDDDEEEEDDDDDED